jgi:transposase-like protein
MVIKKAKYTQEFKAEAVKLVTEQGYSQAEAARRVIPPLLMEFRNRN